MYLDLNTSYKVNMDRVTINKKGVAYIIVATLGFSLIPVLAQVGLSTDFTAATLLFYRFSIAALIFYATV